MKARRSLHHRRALYRDAIRIARPVKPEFLYTLAQLL